MAGVEVYLPLGELRIWFGCGQSVGPRHRADKTLTAWKVPGSKFPVMELDQLKLMPCCPGRSKESDLGVLRVMDVCTSGDPNCGCRQLEVKVTTTSGNLKGVRPSELNLVCRPEKRGDEKRCSAFFCGATFFLDKSGTLRMGWRITFLDWSSMVGGFDGGQSQNVACRDGVGEIPLPHQKHGKWCHADAGPRAHQAERGRSSSR